MKSNKAIGDRIKAVREKLGKTQIDFGLAFNPPVNKSSVSRWEKGETLPSAKRLKYIADLGSVSVDYLINGSGLSLMATKVLLDKAVGGQKLTGDEQKKLAESQLDLHATTSRLAKNSSEEIHQLIEQQRELIDKKPLSILSGYSLSDFLIFFNLVRLYGSDNQNSEMATLLNMFRQIANGTIEYDKDDIIPNIDKFLSSFPVKKDPESSR